MKKLIFIIVILVLIIIGSILFYNQSATKENEGSASGETIVDYPAPPAQFDFEMSSNDERTVYVQDIEREKPYYLVFDYNENDEVTGMYHYYYFKTDAEAGKYYNENIEMLTDPTRFRQIRCIDNYIVCEFLPETYWGMTKKDVQTTYSFLNEE